MGRTRIDRDTNTPIDINHNNDGSYDWCDDDGNSGTGYDNAGDALKDARNNRKGR